MSYILCILLTFIGFPANAVEQSRYALDDDLIYRITFGSTEDIHILLEKGANPNARTSQGNPALSVAVERNDLEAVRMVRVLLGKGANPNAPDKAGNVPLVTAIKNKQAEMVVNLVEQGADVHATSAAGVTVMALAKQTGDTALMKPIQDKLGKEETDAAAMRTPERFRDIIRLYGFHSCAYQYWSYYLASRQVPEQQADTEKKIAASRAQLAQLLQQIRTYYPTTTTEELQHVADKAAHKVYEILDAMVSNRNRAEHGVGTDDDARHRCDDIADSVKGDVAGAF